MNKKTELLLEGLDCAGCANKIEREVQSLTGIKAASLNFLAKKLSIETTEERDLPQLLEEIRKIILKLEPHVKVTTYPSEKPPMVEIIDKRELMRLGVGALLFALALFLKMSPLLNFFLYLSSYLLVGGQVLWKAAKNLLNRQLFDENFLMTIATVGAFAIGQFPEGVAVMLFYQIGEFFQDLVVNQSRKAITSLLNIKAEYANLKTEDEIKQVSPQYVKVGDIIIIKPGEKVPLDGQVIDGHSYLDTSALTGEALPKEVLKGDDVLSGFINKTGLLTVRVNKIFSQSTVAKILDLVENASNKKAPTENFITKFARYYTPFVVFSATALALIPPLILPGASFAQWFYRALVFLVISCPCALVISIPLSFFGGLGGASKNGILIKGGNYLEALNSVDTVVFDKTGTLTQGVFRVTSIQPKKDWTEEKLLEYAALAESYSNHPIATSILQAYGQEPELEQLTDYEELPGQGVKVKINGLEVLAGNGNLMSNHSIPWDDPLAKGTVIHLAVDNQYAGYLVIADQLKEDAGKALGDLKTWGIKNLIILTGDNAGIAQQIGKQLGVDKTFAELLPQDKLSQLENISLNKSSNGKIIFVGDGVNDAPVLARADIGVAMGALGSDAAIEAADIVLMTDEPSKLVTALKIARKTKNIVWQNIGLTMLIKGLVLILGAGGLATMWEAVFADVGVALLAVLNAMRVMKKD